MSRMFFPPTGLLPSDLTLKKFEEMFADRVQLDHTVALASGTSALHLALIHLGVEAGDEVLCSTLTFCASANPIAYLGAQPVFIDADPRDMEHGPAFA